MRRAAALSCLLTSRPSLITFDCTGTLFQPSAPVGALYKRAVVAEGWKVGLAAAAIAEALDEEMLCNAFASAYAAADAARPCFGAGMCTSEEWWRPVVHSTIINAAHGSASEVQPLIAGAFDTLFRETFVSQSGWALCPHAREALEAITDWRRQDSEPDVMLGVISNWDDRLPLLLRRLGIAHHFDMIVTSHELGIEKPSAGIFDRARALAGVATGARCVHVGDSFKRDVVGAATAGKGWEAVHVCSEEERARVSPELLMTAEHLHFESLATLPEWLGASAGAGRN